MAQGVILVTSRWAPRASALSADACPRRLPLEVTETLCVPVDHPTILDHRHELRRTLEHRDVGDGISVPDDDVRELAGGDDADAAFQADHAGVAARAREDRLHRGEAEVCDEDLRLPAVVGSVREGRGIARVRARED